MSLKRWILVIVEENLMLFLLAFFRIYLLLCVLLYSCVAGCVVCCLITVFHAASWVLVVRRNPCSSWVWNSFCHFAVSPTGVFPQIRVSLYCSSSSYHECNSFQPLTDRGVVAGGKEGEGEGRIDDHIVKNTGFLRELERELFLHPTDVYQHVTVIPPLGKHLSSKGISL